MALIVYMVLLNRKPDGGDRWSAGWSERETCSSKAPDGLWPGWFGRNRQARMASRFSASMVETMPWRIVMPWVATT
ncbi:hypothetical protein ABTE26_20095, partial [Acinetobacter baumannii]